VAWNDHTPEMVMAAAKPTGNLGNAIRAGLRVPEFNAMAHSVHARAGEVGAALECLAAVAREAQVPLLSHDDSSPEVRQRYRALGSRISEFPRMLAAAHEARKGGEDVVMGAPNVLRGRSHMGWLSAEEAVAERVCTILASDYYYPALLQAPYTLAAQGLMELGGAWQLVSANPARAAGLPDRGTIAAGQRADLVVVEEGRGLPPRVVTTIVGGRLAFELRPAG
jgi:alpha-D-ribose 1-methylphosphonate 5-triphosphate diphosphatase